MKHCILPLSHSGQNQASDGGPVSPTHGPWNARRQGPMHGSSAASIGSVSFIWSSSVFRVHPDFSDSESPNITSNARPRAAQLTVDKAMICSMSPDNLIACANMCTVNLRKAGAIWRREMETHAVLPHPSRRLSRSQRARNWDLAWVAWPPTCLCTPPWSPYPPICHLWGYPPSGASHRGHSPASESSAHQRSHSSLAAEPEQCLLDLVPLLCLLEVLQLLLHETLSGGQSKASWCMDT